jgi:hypothetical protein
VPPPFTRHVSFPRSSRQEDRARPGVMTAGQAVPPGRKLAGLAPAHRLLLAVTTVPSPRLPCSPTLPRPAIKVPVPCARLPRRSSYSKMANKRRGVAQVLDGLWETPLR